MKPSLEVLLTPSEIDRLPGRDLSQSTCVVFDILRATTTMVTALANGAAGIIPVGQIDEALAIRRQQPEVLLAGERNGFRIDASLTGGTEFDLGNSPREFMPETVRDRTIVMTTTNGTRALKACTRAAVVYVASFLNLRATLEQLNRQPPSHLVLICSGTHDEPALEDILAAGALCEKVWSIYSHGSTTDGAEIARRLYSLMGNNLASALNQTRNGKRLCRIEELREDIRFCAQRETLGVVAEMVDGVVRTREA